MGIDSDIREISINIYPDFLSNRILLLFPNDNWEKRMIRINGNIGDKVLPYISGATDEKIYAMNRADR